MSAPFSDPPRHGQIVGGLSVTPDLDAAICDYRDVLGLELVETGLLDGDLAAAWHAPASAGARIAVPGVDGLRVTPLSLSSKPAPYSPHRECPVDGDNVGLLLENTASGRRIFYAPGLGEITPPVWEMMLAADTVLVDGTFWTDDEMIRLGLSSKTARDIGHLPQSDLPDGTPGMRTMLSRLPARTRKALIHINNTNPILDEASPQRRELSAAGVEVCHDGMVFEF